MSDVKSAPEGFAEAEIVAVLRALPRDRVFVIVQFIKQIIMVYDPDVVLDFITWRADPRIETLLQLASKLDGDALDQLLFVAEDFYQESADPVRH